MIERKIATPSVTRGILKKHGLQLKKSLGQNFLMDFNVLEKIVAVAELDKNTNVLEIGAGIGALSEFLAHYAKKVVALEIDERLLCVLADTLQVYQNIKILNEDILKADLQKIVATEFAGALPLPLKIVANLPFYITTPILLNLLSSGLKIDKMVVMLQKEVALRCTAQPGTKAYGTLTIAIQYYMEASLEFIVPRAVFFPQPNVDSAIISLTSRTTPLVEVNNEKAFFQLTKAAFGMRRKTLWNNLLSTYGKDDETKNKLQLALKLAAIEPTRRGETLTIQEFAKLSNMLIPDPLG